MTTISNPAHLRCLDSSGNSGLVTPGTLLKNLSYIFRSGGIAGGQPTKWIGLGKFYMGPYSPIRIDIISGQYNMASGRSEINLVLTWNGQLYAYGTGKNIIGYILNGSNLDIYLKLSSVHAYNGWIFGTFVSTLIDTTTEPSGIVYIP